MIGKNDLNNHRHLQKDDKKNNNENQNNKNLKDLEDNSKRKSSGDDLLTNANNDLELNGKNNINSYKEENKNKLNIIKNNKINNHNNPNSKVGRKTKIKSLILVEVKGTKNKHLIIEPQNDYKEVVKKFCLENKLDSNKYMILLNAVKNKIKLYN